MKHRIHWMERLEFMDEALPRRSLVELCGDRRVLIENHEGICQFGTDKIAVKVRFGCVIVVGESLKLCRMSAQQLIIAGKICRIELSRRGKP